MIFVKAYQAYQQKNYDRCLKLLQEVKYNDVRRLDLEAQVFFQMKEYREAYDIYRKLIRLGGEFTQERKDNILTVIVCAQLEQPDTLELLDNDVLPLETDIIEQVELINLTDKNVTDMSSKPEPSKRNKKQKKRKIRLPKQYDPVAGPDPERWLPRRDRKGNAHKLRKRRQRPNTKVATRDFSRKAK